MDTQQRPHHLVKTLVILLILSLFAYQSFLIPSSNAVALQKADSATICQGNGSGGPISSSCYINPWQFTSSFNHPRSGHTAIVYGNHIYILGGAGVSVEQAVINPDNTLGAWQDDSPMTTERGGYAQGGIAAIVVNSYIYAMGGLTNTIERVKINPDGSLGVWQLLPTTLTVSYYIAAVTSGDYLYVIGGEYFHPTKIVLRAKINPDGSLGSWQPMSSMILERTRMGAVVLKGFIYVFGGDTSYGTASSVERAPINEDGTLGEWQMVSSMLMRRRGMAVVATQLYIYVIGGYNGNENYSSSVERAAILPDGTLADWQFVDSMNTERDSSAGVLANNSIYMIGGYNSIDSSVSTSVEYVDASKIGIPPEYGVTINNGSLFTNQIAVTLTISSRPNTYMIQVSNDGGFYGAQWEPCVLSKPWTIVQYGNFIIPRVVYIRFKDIYGVVSATYQDDIILDMAPPTGSISISPGPANMQLEQDLPREADSYAGGEIKSSQTYSYTVYLPIIYTPPPMVVLHLSAQDDVSGVAGMLISDDPSFSGASWEPFVPQKTRYVTSLNQAITVYAKFQDYAGNVSQVYSATYTP